MNLQSVNLKLLLNEIKRRKIIASSNIWQGSEKEENKCFFLDPERIRAQVRVSVRMYQQLHKESIYLNRK